MKSPLLTQIGIAVLLWIVATALVIAIAPFIGALPLPVTVPLVTALFIVVGRVLTGVYVERSSNRRPFSGSRLGVVVVVVQQTLDAILVAAWGGRYPNTTIETNGPVLTLLLGGYAAFLLGAALVDVGRGETPGR
ncbi:MAG: hypothetical protein MI724_15715 [Spirochaetales bacterium]|nr:hypothetical protein [Spirochaetales bacterium]